MGSTSNIHKLLHMLKEQKPKATLLLALDKDNGGEQAANTLLDELSNKNIKAYTVDIYGPYKDANEALLADQDGLVEAINKAERQALEEEQAAKEAQTKEYQRTSAAHSLQEFVKGL